MVEYSCEFCGKEKTVPASQYRRSQHHFCSALCRNRFYNPEKNKRLMTPEVRAKLRDIRLGAGEGSSYEKTYGRHTHRVVAEQILGRPLQDGEVVHHLDGNRRNNSPENLMVFASQKEHAEWHAKKRKEMMSNAICPEKASADCG